MAKQPTCLVCQKAMEPGFIAELSSGGGVRQPRWCPGEPSPTWFTGGDAKGRQYEDGVRVVAYRCPECEALRLYAPSSPA